MCSTVLNNNQKRRTIFEKTLKVDLLPIPQLRKRIETFKFNISDNDNKVLLRLLVYSREIDTLFFCPKDLKVQDLKKNVLKHFQFEDYTDINCPHTIIWHIEANNKRLKEETKTLFQSGVKDGDQIRLFMQILFKAGYQNLYQEDIRVLHKGGSGGGITITIDDIHV